MYKKYKFPISIFITFQHLQPIVFSSEVLTPNHYVIVLSKNYQYGLNQFLKKELFFFQGSLLEVSAIDTLEYSKIFPKNINVNFLKNRLLVYYTYYFYLIKLRLSVFYTYSLNSGQKPFYSVDRIFKNANWLEREVSEMYNINFYLKTDTRNLLLDYSRNEHPLLKDFPCEGFQELYYDFFDQTLAYTRSEHIEL